ncbi:sulfite exporter TauE/SafE family protein [Roseateles oligotrophus]|uniref:Sulfite exporter TauE/SafE family protein n=1 Tax=Roseateles oligotrophus TaxID=1769250 RepID=A0ABT2YH03_9BURK|nr:sulfite exporter TauE/SafE family protein [Roseateles oligotrophus]MCV2369297.1 sulfite exporter TauE/SafE family protein [Roseateles oligotrophus]
MLDFALAGSALMMGLAGTPHCLAMCGAASTAVSGSSRAGQMGFQLGRLLSYATAGGLAAASVSLLAQWGQASALLRPLWVLLHVAAFLLGLALLWRGRQPAWLEGMGQRISSGIRPAVSVSLDGLKGGATVFARPARAGMLGLAWAAWPCGLLQSALLVAALASGPAQGAAVMAVFAMASGLGLALGPMLWVKLQGQGGGSGAVGMRWSVRLSGLGLAGASGWALGHGVWSQVVEFCQ